MNNNNEKLPCEICHKKFALSSLFPIKLVRPSVIQSCADEYPDLNHGGYICQQDLRKIRTNHIEKSLIEDKGALSALDREVLESLQNEEILAENVNKKFERRLTFGEKLADNVAKFGGSWKFIITFGIVLVTWMAINAFVLLNNAFDPYPFILLNLVLSCLAAIQAPIIMMSQNRHTEKERLQANEEYATNLKAELEVQQLHSKIDLFMKKQWQTMLEIQKIQLELVEDLFDKKGKKKTISE